MQDQELRKSVKIGTTCIITYLATYFMRNILGVLTPEMLQTGLFTKEWIGALSSAYMLLYAAGQLTNGFLGDRFPPKNMIATGLFLAGTASSAFPFVPHFYIQVVLFGLFGYGLSMLRGPMMKMISENTKDTHSRVICAFFSSAGFVGAFFAGLFAAVFRWDRAFIIAGMICLFMAATSYVVFFWMERSHALKRNDDPHMKMSKEGFFGAFRAERFVFYLIVSIILEITTTSINFWIPTYLTEHLRLTNNVANTVYIIKNLLRSLSPIIAIMIYTRVRNEMKILKHSFWLSAAILLGMLFVKAPWVNIVLFVIALIVSGFASAVLWSIYLPSLKNTGNVSSANGILDSAGYIGASVSNMVFASLADRVGWNGIIVLWTGIIFAGFVATVIEEISEKYKRLRNR